jgi:hypothetical protein
MAARARATSAEAAEAEDPEPTDISIYGITLEEVHEFVYLGRLVTNDCKDLPEVRRRIAIARTTWNRLRMKYFGPSSSLPAKLAVFRAVISSVLLYSCETWHLTPHMQGELRSFQAQCLRHILKRPMHTDPDTGELTMPPTTELLETAKMEDIVVHWRRRRLLWTVREMQQDPTFTFHSGTRHRGWHAAVQHDMARVGLDPLTDGMSVWRAHLKTDLVVRQLV